MKKFHLLLSNPFPSCSMGIIVCDQENRNKLGHLSYGTQFAKGTVMSKYTALVTGQIQL